MPWAVLAWGFLSPQFWGLLKFEGWSVQIWTELNFEAILAASGGENHSPIPPTFRGKGRS